MQKYDKREKFSIASILLCSLGAAFLVVLSTAKSGPGLTHDSAAYTYAAQSFLQGEGFRYFGYPSPFIQWPPLYPFLLALGELAGIAAGNTAILVNSLAFALTVFFAGRWMLSKFQNRYIAIGGTFLLFLSVPLLQVSIYLWTEILFVLFFLLSYIELEKFLLHGKYGSLVLAALFSALACIDRYAGVTIVAAVCLVLLFYTKGLMKGIICAAVYGAVSIVPMGAWVVRNYVVSGTLLGVRLPSTYPLLLNMKRTLNSIYTWVQPERLLSMHAAAPVLAIMKLFAILVPIFVIIVFVIFQIKNLHFFLSARKSFISGKAEGAGIEVKTKESGNIHLKVESLLPIFFFTIFCVIYIVYLIASATAVAFEPINSRYLIPVYLPIVLGVLAAMDYIIRHINTNLLRLKTISVLLIGLYLVFPAANTAATVLDSWRDGAGGYATTAWRDKNGFLQYMQKAKNGGATYYSNHADVVYVMSGIRTYSPPKKSGPYMYGLEQFQKAVERDENSIVIWFDNPVPQTLYNLEELSRLYAIKEIGNFQNGKIYRIIK